jgi:nicotinamide riboside kinase
MSGISAQHLIVTNGRVATGQSNVVCRCATNLAAVVPVVYSRAFIHQHADDLFAFRRTQYSSTILTPMVHIQDAAAALSCALSLSS